MAGVIVPSPRGKTITRTTANGQTFVATFSLRLKLGKRKKKRIDERMHREAKQMGNPRDPRPDCVEADDDDPRYTRRTLPYLGDSRGNDPYGPPPSDPVLPREYGVDSHWSSIPNTAGRVMGGGGGSRPIDNGRWLP